VVEVPCGAIIQIANDIIAEATTLLMIERH
jgi:hypothetical protein